MIQRLLAWIARNERHLGAVFFVFGFITDLLTFTLLEISVVNVAFLGYLALAAVFAVLGHTAYGWKQTRSTPFFRTLPAISSLVVQYAIGGILSGCLIFFTKSSSILASWPFLLLLALIFFGNEYFRKYREHLAFQTILLFFGLYAYTIFALPLLVKTLGPIVFLGSTLISLALFALFLWVLWKIGKERLLSALRMIVAGVTGTVLLVVGAYFTGAVPPIPLTLADVGIYQQLERVPGGYSVQGETGHSWWQFWPRTVHHVAGAPLYAYSSVFAPVAFSTSVVHEWQRYDEQAHEWVQESRIAFVISGGRKEGFRGYSVKDNPQPGKWRISIETMSGQVIGRETFYIQEVQTPSKLQRLFK